MTVKAVRVANRAMAVAFWVIAALILASTGLGFLSRYETALAPVLSDFDVLRIEPVHDSVLLSGRMRKQRACAYRSLVAYVGDYRDPDHESERVHVRFLDIPAESDPTRATGLQHWGPWRVTRPKAVTGPDVWIRITHRCNPLYETTGVYLVTDAVTVFGETPR